MYRYGGQSHDDPADQIKAVCSFASATICVLSVCHLSSMPKSTRNRLFWQQLLALTVLDVLLGVCKGLNLGDARLWWLLDFWCCLLDVQIAFGFAVAALGAGKCLIRSFRLAIPISGLLSLGLSLGLYRHHEQGGTDYPWSIVSAGCCGVCLLAYGLAVVGALGCPASAVRRRVLLHGATYIFNILITQAPLALVPMLQAGWMECRPSSSALPVSWCLVAHYLSRLQGLMNVCTYLLWSQWLHRYPDSMVADTLSSKWTAFAKHFELDWLDEKETPRLVVGV